MTFHNYNAKCFVALYKFSDRSKKSTIDCDRLLLEHKKRLKKALEHLKYSYEKVKSLPTSPQKINEQQLETWESFVMRFARLADIFIIQYLRTFILSKDPAFDGFVRDILDAAEKIHLIESADQWMGIRRLRNIISHEYKDADLEKHFKEIRDVTPLVIHETEKV